MNDGGPLLVLPEAAEAGWNGNDATRRADRSRGEIHAPTDYDRACASAGHVAPLVIGSSWGLVFGDVTSSTVAFLGDLSLGSIYVVGVDAHDDPSESNLLSTISSASSEDWETIFPSTKLTGRGMLLLHAASTASEVRELSADTPGTAAIGDGIRRSAATGLFHVDHCLLRPERGSYLACVRLQQTLTAVA